MLMTAPSCFRYSKGWRSELPARNCFGDRLARLRRIFQRCKGLISANSKNAHALNLSASKRCASKWRGKRFGFSAVAGIDDPGPASPMPAPILLPAGCGNYRLAACAPQNGVALLARKVRIAFAMTLKSFSILLIFVSTAAGQTPAPGISSAKHPFTFEDMMKLKRVGAPVPSPDGKWVVFDCEDVDLEVNTKISHLWIMPASGGESRRLNPTPNHEERPRFSPDGKRLIWTSKATEPTQIWTCDFDTSAGALTGQPHQVTNISTGADGGIWSPDGKNIVFVSAVYPDCKDDACNKQRDDELKKSKVKAKIFTRLFYRHWNTYTEFKRNHLFVVSADANSSTDILSVGSAGVSPAESSSVSRAASETPDKMSGGPTGKMPVL